jgi:CBS domain-containing protein
MMKKRGGNGGDDWDTWEPEPAETFQPMQAPISGAGSAPSPRTPPPVRPLDAEYRNGERGQGTSTASPSAAQGATGDGRRSVRDVMTPNPETVAPMTDAPTAARMMRDLNVGVLPVLADGRLAGIVTDRDIAVGFSTREMEPAMVKVGDLMTDAPATVKPDDSVAEAARMMAERQVRRLPVIEGARLVGIVSLGDLATEGAQRAAGTALHEISEPARPDR